MAWDPLVYGAFDDERSRPFQELVGRIDADAPARVVDLGCGSGALTATLSARWPGADVLGIDSSAEMLARARPGPRLRFELGDIAAWAPRPAAPEVLVSNAALQWVPGHARLLQTWAQALPAGGWLAFQVPANFGSPSHVLLRETAESPQWRGRLRGVLRHEGAVETLDAYWRILAGAACRVDAWETRYLHVLQGADPVLEWVRGTALRPVLAALGPDAARFEEQYAQRLRDAYPSTEHGTAFPFLRRFVVAQRA